MNIKRRSKKGFTLMEMLIVVAIIAILIAIAIPTFSSSLNDAKDKADKANVRAWYAEQVIQEMTDPSFDIADTYPTTGEFAVTAGGVTVSGEDSLDTFSVIYESNNGFDALVLNAPEGDDDSE